MQAQFVSDGDFATAYQNGIWDYEFPFSDKADFTSFVAHRKMRQDAASFIPPTPMASRSFGLGIAYLAAIGSPARVDETSGLIEWSESWASVPITRVEFGSQNYTQTVAGSGAGGSIVVGSITYSNISIVLDCAYLFEYARMLSQPSLEFTQQPGSGYAYAWPQNVLPTTHAPRYIAVDGRVFLYGNPAQIVAQTGPIQAQDSETSIYMGLILCRKAIYVNRETPQQIV